MKELSIEEKAKRYDEAMYRAKHFLTVIGVSPDDEPIDVAKRMSEYVFPKLKESEDEKIRKELIRIVDIWTNSSPVVNGIPRETLLAWLEKQDSYYSFEIKEGHWYKCVCDYMLNNSDLMFKNDRLYYCRSDWRLRGEIDERNVKDIGVKGYKSFFRPATNQEIKDWLEKQGEQKPADTVESKFKVGDIIRHKELGFTCKITAVDTEYRVSECNGTHLPFDSQDAYELVEQKSAWSEEDEVMFRKAIITIDNVRMNTEFSEYYQSISKWLKSLKDRFTWKPSSQQICALDYVIKEYESTNISLNKEAVKQLISLRENLKAL